MAEADVIFEREERDGVVAVGTYVIDAAGRLGIEIDADCGRHGECDSCAVTIKKGGNLLSETTKAETEHLTEDRRKKGERLACQAKIEKSGEVVIMTKEKKVEEKPEAEEKNEEFRKEFAEMPLEKKIASLVELEAMALSETFSFVINSPFKIVDMAMGVMAEMGLKLEDDAKKAKRPDEHQPEEEKAEEKNGKKEETGKTEKKSPKAKTSRSSSKKTAEQTKKASDKKASKEGEEE
ncbi:MAG: 2Fe-2S iron-sulfur cluster binding domain-containing protein [Pyrinomonadaceae bacterium]